MNQKAQKQTLSWPPQFNMCNDRPHIDDQFSNVEKINTPFLNDMLQPVWVKSLEQTVIHDADGNPYTIEDGKFCRGEYVISNVTPKKFVKTDITDELILAHDIDIDSDSIIAATRWDGDNNRFFVQYGELSAVTPKLYEDGVVVASRVRIIDGAVWLIVHYDINDIPYLMIFKLSQDGSEVLYNEELKWYKQVIRANTSEALSTMFVRMSIENADTVIHIGKVTSDVIGVSLISDRNKAINTANNGFATYFIKDNSVKQLGYDIFPTSETSSVTVTNTASMRWRASTSRSISSHSGTCISADGNNYYDYTTEGVIGDDLNIPVTYTPTATGNTVAIDGTEYSLYNYSCSVHTFTLNIRVSDNSAVWSFSATAADGTDFTGTDISGTQKCEYSVNYWRGQDAMASNEAWSSLTTTYRGVANNIDIDNKSHVFDFQWTEEISAGWLATPNIVIDSGQLYSMWALRNGYQSGNSWTTQILTAGNIIEESGIVSNMDWDSSQYTVSPTEYVTVTSNYQVARSNSVVALQNLFVSTVKLNNTAATSSYTLYNNGGTAGSESTSSKFLEYVNSNVTDLRYYPGTIRDTTFNYFGNQMYTGDTVVGNAEDCLVFIENGFRTTVRPADRFLLGSSNCPFNILYQIDSSNTAYPISISYSEDISRMGTLVAPWTSIDESFYIVGNSNCVIYRDKQKRYYRISIEDGNDLTALLDDRYILINTTSYWNMWDSKLSKKLHYATDYNNRVLFGQIPVPDANMLLAGANSSGAVTYSRMTATAINANYKIQPKLAVASIQLPVQTRTRVFMNAERPYSCVVDESSDIQPINVFYGTVGGTSAEYKFDLYPFNVYNRKFSLDSDESSYAVSSAILSPNMFTKLINGAGNNDMAAEDYESYVLTYYSQQPYFLYNLSTQTSAVSATAKFFVIQGQFYSFTNEKIYSMIYSNGSIASQDAIADCRGMVFVGNNTQIAFFFSPSKRQFYSFTGDGILQAIYYASKLTEILNDNYWYDEMTQTIYVPTSMGLLCFGQKNVYCFENWKNVTNVQISNDGITHITNDGVTYNMAYYDTAEGYSILPADIETSFYGLGANQWTSIDRWDITLYANNHVKDMSYITVGVRSITDVTVKSEEKTIKITPDMYDEWSNSILIRYVPKLQKGQGIRLYLKTPLTIQKIVPHIADMGTGTLTRRGL